MTTRIRNWRWRRKPVNKQKMKQTTIIPPFRKPRPKCVSIVKTLPYTVYSWRIVKNTYGETFTTMCVHVNYAVVTHSLHVLLQSLTKLLKECVIIILYLGQLHSPIVWFSSQNSNQHCRGEKGETNSRIDNKCSISTYSWSVSKHLFLNVPTNFVNDYLNFTNDKIALKLIFIYV